MNCTPKVGHNFLGLFMSGRRKYSYSQRLNAVFEIIEQHQSFRAVARSLETSHKHIRRWVAL